MRIRIENLIVAFYLFSVIAVSVVCALLIPETLFWPRLVIGVALLVGSLLAFSGYLRLTRGDSTIPLLLLWNIVFSLSLAILAIGFIALGFSGALQTEVTIYVRTLYAIFFGAAYLVLSGGLFIYLGAKRHWLGYRVRKFRLRKDY